MNDYLSILDNHARFLHTGLEIAEVEMDQSMHVSTASRFAVRAVFDIAYHGGDQPTQIKEICKRQKLSQRYLEQIFNKLVRAGLLKAKRGPHGGYMLSRPPLKITVLDIINAAQGPILLVACLDEETRNCPMYPLCVTRHVWKETQNLLANYFESVSIADLCASASKQRLPRDSSHKYMYYI